jgi:non-ribosomal peptide synthetase component F
VNKSVPMQDTLQDSADAPDSSVLIAAVPEQMLADRNETQYPGQNLGLHQLIAAQAARTPDLPAVAFEEGCLTYQELDRRFRRGNVPSNQRELRRPLQTRPQPLPRNVRRSFRCGRWSRKSRDSP